MRKGRKSYTLAVLLLSVSVFVFGSDSSTEGRESVRVLSWNVRNYNLSNRFLEGKYLVDYPKPEIETTALMEVIQIYDPEVILLQEIGSEAFLSELVRDLEVAHGLKFSHNHVVEAEDKTRKLAFLSKLPIEVRDNPITNRKTFSYFETRKGVKRGLLTAEIELAGQKILLSTLHLKSRYSENPKDPSSAIRREKEARLIRDYFLEVLDSEPELPILLLGDFNDHAGSATYRRFSEVAGKTIFQELALKDGKGECWTFYYEKNRVYEQIDFAWLSPSLATSKRFKIEGFIADHELVRKASDHRPILIDLRAK